MKTIFAFAFALVLVSSIALGDVPDNWNGKLAKGEPASDFETNMPPLMATKDALHGKPLTAAPTTHDVLILYTRAALTKHTQAGIDKLVQRVVDDANAAYASSQVHVTLRLADKGLSPVNESGSGLSLTLKNFRENSTVKAWRDRVHADMTLLLSLDTGTYVGMASLYIINGNVEAFAAMKTSAVAGRTGAHEFGHLQGLSHNIENKNQEPAFPWGYGYRRCVTDGTGWRDVMSYPCGSGMRSPRQNFFGNPDVSYNGNPTGTRQADAAHALDDNGAYVASYR